MEAATDQIELIEPTVQFVSGGSRVQITLDARELHQLAEVRLVAAANDINHALDRTDWEHPHERALALLHATREAYEAGEVLYELVAMPEKKTS